MQIIGKSINPNKILEFSAEVKTTYRQLAKVQFINQAGVLRSSIDLGNCLSGVQAIADKYRTVDYTRTAQMDWDRIDRQRRYNAAVIRNQVKALRLNK